MMTEVRNYPPHLQDVFHAHPLASLAKSLLASLGPDLIKAWHDEGSSGDLENHLEWASNYLLGNLWLTHVEHLGEITLYSFPSFIINIYDHLFSIYSPDIIHLLQASTIRGGESLKTKSLEKFFSFLFP